MRKKILIIGGGASGMVAAIVAARNGADVTILEQKSEMGKKILATGNGRCNYTNLSMDISDYYCEHKEFIRNLVAEYTPQVIMEFFESLGILSRERNGYVYPLTDQASSIREALVNELVDLGVTLCVDTAATQIRMKENKVHHTTYSVSTNNGTYVCDTLIIATGGKSGLGKNTVYDGFSLIGHTNHTITTLSPSLVPLKGEGKFYKKIAGIRTDASVTAIVNGKKMRTEVGEIQLTDYGISGIPVFQISRIITQELNANTEKSLSVEVDFLPTYTLEELNTFFVKRAATFQSRTMRSFLNGILKDKLALFMLNTAKIEASKRVSNVSQEEFQKLARICKTFLVSIEGAKEFMQSQVTAGGIPVDEVYAHLESKFHKHLYFTGEVLDVDGICGGYNLHFAWATGMIAGSHCTMGKIRS